MIWLVQLVFDCANPDPLAQFWGQTLEYRNSLVAASPEEIRAFRSEYPQFDGRGRVDDDDLRRMPIYIQRVSEPKTQRNRVRLEIATPFDALGATLDRLHALGATPTTTPLEFHDVEGNEFTVTPTDGHTVRLRSIVIDSVDPERLLHFWSAATGYRRAGLRCDPVPVGLTWTGTAFDLHGTTLRHISGAGGRPSPALYDLMPGLVFIEAEEAKTTKNRIHVDLNSTDLQADREGLVDLGATILRWDTDHVLADPEGNEFCLSGRP